MEKITSIFKPVTLQALCILLLTVALFSSCNPGSHHETSAKTEENSEKARTAVPDFNADSAFSYVRHQVAFGPRVCNTPAHEKCGDYLANRLRTVCKDVIIQKGKVKAYNGTLLNFSNIIGSFRPELSNRILLCSHWDSRPYADQDPDPKNHNKPIDGANDGASGVGVLLEIARQLSMSPSPVGVDILILDAEDYGPPEDKETTEDTSDWWGLGAQYWAAHPHKTNYAARYGILLDMVGATDATFLMESFSMKYAPSIVKSVWSTAWQAGYSRFFPEEEGLPITDDHLFINKIINIPTIDIIHLDRNSKTGFTPSWHTLKDNISVIDKNTLKAVGQTLLTVIYQEK
ncbi:MAG: M28 family peptidase [Bacteroidota bacterium]|nr:M28 family peptidase [Bacteroidota bacterium]